VYEVIVKLTFAISSPDEFLVKSCYRETQK